MKLSHEFFLPRVLEATAPYMTGPTTVLLGGSQVINGGAYVTPGSDYDVLVVGRHILHPTSLTARISGAKFDIILRDPETLAYDFHEAPINGRGTLLHLCHFGRLIHDSWKRGPSISTAAQKIYTQGPTPITRKSAEDVLSNLTNSIKDTLLAPPAFRVVMSLVLAHQLGEAALRFSKNWTSRGKILGRFLLEHLPDVKNAIEQGFQASLSGDIRPYTHLVQETLPALLTSSPHGVPYYMKGKMIHDPDNEGDAFTCLRTCPDALHPYLQFPAGSISKKAAHLWLQIKYQMADQAVTSDRIGRTSNEYFYATARLVNYLISADLLQRGEDPHAHPLIDRVSYWNQHNPSAVSDIQKALLGNPTSLRVLGQKIQRALIQSDPATPLPPRISSATQRIYRRDGALIL